MADDKLVKMVEVTQPTTEKKHRGRPRKNPNDPTVKKEGKKKVSFAQVTKVHSLLFDGGIDKNEALDFANKFKTDNEKIEFWRLARPAGVVQIHVKQEVLAGTKMREAKLDEREAKLAEREAALREREEALEAWGLAHGEKPESETWEDKMSRENFKKA